jgi:putative FmdB family regulatory protein
MPIFEFRCNSCSRKFATLVGMTADGSDIVCPHCGAHEATKLISRFRPLG